MRTSYPSDISKEQFEIIEPLLEAAKKKTKPRKLELYDIFCGLIYVLTTGCQWREMPHDFPKWTSVYFYFQIWNKKEIDKESLLEIVLKKISHGLSGKLRERCQSQHANSRFTER